MIENSTVLWQRQREAFLDDNFGAVSIQIGSLHCLKKYGEMSFPLRCEASKHSNFGIFHFNVTGNDFQNVFFLGLLECSLHSPIYSSTDCGCKRISSSNHQIFRAFSLIYRKFGKRQVHHRLFNADYAGCIDFFIVNSRGSLTKYHGKIKFCQRALRHSLR